MTSCIYYRLRYIFFSNAKKSNDNAIISPGKYQDNADNDDATSAMCYTWKSDVEILFAESNYLKLNYNLVYYHVYIVSYC